MSKTKTLQWLLTVLIAFFPFNTQAALNNSGKIFLQVEENGEAWYANPSDGNLYYLGRPLDAFNLMKTFGLGISDKDITLIPIGLVPTSAADTDQDGLADELENIIGTNYLGADSDNDDFSDKMEIENWHNPKGSGKLPENKNLAAKLKGKILIQVEKKGAGWYVNPSDHKRYYLGRPLNAFEIMYNLGVGISNKDLAKLPVNYFQATSKNNHYELKYPNIWTKFEQAPPTVGTYNKITVVQQTQFKMPNDKGDLFIFVLEGVNEYSLGDFNISARQNADKIIHQDLLVGVKPAIKQKFKYTIPFTSAGKQFNRGAELVGDIMISTKKFIHLDLVIYQEGDIALYESYFDKMLKDMKIIY